jgi:hypothetical protein
MKKLREIIRVCVTLALFAPLAAVAQVSSNHSTSAITPATQTASEHAAGDAIGGWQTVSFFRDVAHTTGLLSNVMLISTGGTTQPVSFFIYTKNVTATSTCTDNAAFVENDADAPFRAVAPFTITPSAVVGSTNTGGSFPLAASIANQDSSPTMNLYVCMVAGAPLIPASTTDLSFKLSGIRD